MHWDILNLSAQNYLQLVVSLVFLTLLLKMFSTQLKLNTFKKQYLWPFLLNHIAKLKKCTLALCSILSLVFKSYFPVLIPHLRFLSWLLIFVSCLCSPSSLLNLVSHVRSLSSFPIFVPCINSLSSHAINHIEDKKARIEDEVAVMAPVDHECRKQCPT